MNTTMQQRVSTGVATLNALIPNWRERINVETFNITNINDCIMGQLGGDYGQVIEELFGDYEPAYICGFSVPYEEARENIYSDDDDNPWVELQNEWMKVLLVGTEEIKATHITANHDGDVITTDSEPVCEVFETSRFFPALDGTWLVVDFFEAPGAYWSWYVVQSK